MKWKLSVAAKGNTVSFEIAVYREREVEIRGRFTGSVAEGYLPGDEEDFVFSPEPCWSAGRRAWSTKWPMRW